MFLIFLGVLLLVYFIWNFLYTYSEITYVKSNIDNRTYMIRRGHSKSQEFLKMSADTLAEINLRVEKLINFVDQTYGKDSSKNYFIKKLVSNYSPYMISEAEIDPRYTTYTVDKENMHICLRTRDKFENVYDLNILMYVVLHELAHLCNYSQSGEAIIGHGLEFRSIFRFLVENAMKIGVYNYTDYSKTPVEYCGISISSQIL
jgi:hypothetical protein